MIERYEDPKIKEIFSEKRKFQTYFDIEVAYASFVHGRYEDKHKNKYNRTVVNEEIISSIKEIEKTTKHEMASVVDYLCKEYDSNYIHLGLTSSDEYN